MRKFLLILGCLLPYASSVEAGLWYIKGSGGVNFINAEGSAEINPGYYVAGSLGYRFSPFFRIEAEGAYRHNNLHKLIYDTLEIPFDTPIHTSAAMGNLFLDFPCFEVLFPYIGGGIGAQWVRSHGTCYAEDEDNIYVLKYRIKHNGFAYQVIAGIGVELGIRNKLIVDYRYLNGVDALANHTLAMSLMHDF